MSKPGKTTDGKTGPSLCIHAPRSTLTSTWEASLVPVLSAFTVIFSYDNIQGAFHGAYKGHQEFVTGVIQVAIFVLYILLKLIDFPTYRAKILIYRQYGDTAVIVIMAYVLLLDINLSYSWLVMFPASVIYALPLYMELRTPGERGELALADYTGSSSTTKRSERFLSAMAELLMPFGALLVMAQLDDKEARRFVISQFLVFLSTTMGAVTYMMMSPPAGSQRLAPGSDLLHKAFLILLLVTAHTVAGEALGEQVIQACMPELVPVILWFSVHIDRKSPVISVNQVAKLRIIILGTVALVGGPLLACVANSKDEYFLSWCKGIMMSSGVSGLLTCYIVFMLRQWPRRHQAAAAAAAAAAGSSGEIVQSKKGTAGSPDETALSKEQAVSSSHGAVHYKEQGAAGSSEEAVHVQLLEVWAILLLTVAAALLLMIKPLDPTLLMSKNPSTVYTLQ